MSSVELRKVTKRFGAAEVIHSLDLHVPDGSFTALLGPSGCGKSTLLRLIAGLEEVSEGSVLIGGEDMTTREPAQRRVAMVFQSYALYPHLTVEQNICFSMSLARRPKAEQREAALRVAKMLQLEPLLKRRPAQLSGGQRQRVAIGRALVREPGAFLFDEPLSNLDALLRVQMRLELAKLHNDIGTTMIYVTHDQVEAMTLASQIVVLDQGVVQQVGTPLELYNKPVNRFVAGFIGSPAMNFMRAEAKDGRLEVVGGVNISFAAPSNVTEIGVRPEHVTLVAEGDGVLAGRVSVVEQLGNTSYVYLDTGAGEIIAESDPAQLVGPGDVLGVQIDPEKLSLFDAEGRSVPIGNA